MDNVIIIAAVAGLVVGYFIAWLFGRSSKKNAVAEVESRLNTSQRSLKKAAPSL